jgi:tetratricopeptide (TPR) repeat protein
VPLLKTGIEGARSLGLSALEAPLRLNLGMALTALGRHEEAAVELDRAMACREVVGDARVATDVALHHAESLLRRGRVDDAAAIVANVRAELPPSSPYQTLALLLGARVAEARGDLLLAQAEAEAAVQTLVEGGAPADAAEAAVWIALAEIRRKNGDGPGAEEAISSGWSRVVASLEALGELRDAALKAVPELARLEELAIEIGLSPPSEVPVRDTLPP